MPLVLNYTPYLRTLTRAMRQPFAFLPYMHSDCELRTWGAPNAVYRLVDQSETAESSSLSLTALPLQITETHTVAACKSVDIYINDLFGKANAGGRFSGGQFVLSGSPAVHMCTQTMAQQHRLWNIHDKDDTSPLSAIVCRWTYMSPQIKFDLKFRRCRQQPATINNSINYRKPKTNPQYRSSSPKDSVTLQKSIILLKLIENPISRHHRIKYFFYKSLHYHSSIGNSVAFPLVTET